MNVGILDILTIIMIFQLLVFSLFLLVRKVKNVSNYLLALQLFSQAAGIANGFCFQQFDFFYNKFPDLFFTGFPFMFLWGPTFYLYAKSASFSDFKLKFRHLPHFIPFFAALIFLLFSFYLLSTEEKKLILIRSDFPIYLYRTAIDIFLRAHVFVYIILSIFLLYGVNQKIRQKYSSISQTHIGWIEFLVAGFSISYILTIPIIIYGYIYGRKSETLVILISLPYFVYFNIILFKAWYRSEIFAGVEEAKYKSSKLAKKEAEGLIKKLNEYVQCEKPYLNSELTLGQLAENLNISPRILSQVINDYFNQNFYDYINRLRVEESKKSLLDVSNKKTVLEILYDVGFNTKSSYNVAFKKATGLTPTEFKRRHSYKPLSSSEYS